ncbi:glycosyltransferase family 4 protein [Demequina zhanjiangensis]|uniref:Glycosyltransferase family 4 protein n=1 Tax=Demequina zhanjiangensis TaxID=3051659 RepID=A0ABT8FWW7_9MICO|nr:glycosyltransferase family 4 protein [Demequina sp. SYSU T00b26]MDN4471389.1 glycosyltransferase family 4 protein [Demequina sp. SYSU T00b26]
MKIAFVLDDSIARPDGVQQYVTALGAALQGAGHDVVYACSGDVRDDLPAVSLTANIGVTFNGNGLRTPRPASRRLLREWLEQERPDVIHVQMPHSPVFAGRVVQEARRVLGDNVRIVGTFHILPDGKVSELGTALLGRILRRNLQLFDAFSAVSEPAVGFAKQAFGIDCTLVSCLVDVDAFRAEAARPRPVDDGSRPLTVSFLGRFVERKGVRELIEAVSALPPESRDRIHVRMGGRGPLLGSVEALVAEEGLEREISLEGFVAEEDKAQFYADADIAVFPATGGESFGIVLIEAMAAGAGVVVGGDNPGYRFVLQDDGVLVDARDTRAFSLLLELLISDPERRAAIHASQQRRVRDFDVPVTLAAALELYGA